MIEESVTFDAEGLAIEGLFSYADDLRQPKAKVLLCPPHPFLGGDMQNNVIAHLNSALAEQGYLVLRFNYRGIGNSQSKRALEADQQAFWNDSRCPEYEAEMFTDCRAALTWLQQQPDRQQPILTLGYSFGCLPALKMARCEAQVHGCALISPPLNRWSIPARDLQFRKPKGLFYSPGDFACDSEHLQRLFAGMSKPKQLWETADADHFFIKKEALLSEQVSRFLADI